MMTPVDIARQRLHNQQITRHTFDKPDEVVRWLGAVQSQDYASEKWAVGQRVRGATDAAIEQAFTDGAILRTHLMRPTWHFVTPADIRWILDLTAPRVKAINTYHDRTLELDDALFARSNAVLAKALQGGKHLTRPELASILQQAGIATDDSRRFGHIVFRAELDQIVCSGARRGTQQTYALLDERAPNARVLAREEALAELANRYFTSHGPATLKDYRWWSGLTAADANAGLAMIKPQLIHETVDGQTYWFVPSPPTAEDLSATAPLLPNFDEYLVGYIDRSAAFDTQHTEKVGYRGNVLFYHTIVIDGRIVGTWKRTVKKNILTIVPRLFVPLSEAEACALTVAAERYGTFLKAVASNE